MTVCGCGIGRQSGVNDKALVVACGGTFGPGPPRAPDAVDVVFDVPREIVVDDGVNVAHVQPTGRDICGYLKSNPGEKCLPELLA